MIYHVQQHEFKITVEEAEDDFLSKWICQCGEKGDPNKRYSNEESAILGAKVDAHKHYEAAHLKRTSSKVVLISMFIVFFTFLSLFIISYYHLDGKEHIDFFRYIFIAAPIALAFSTILESFGVFKSGAWSVGGGVVFFSFILIVILMSSLYVNDYVKIANKTADFCEEIMGSSSASKLPIENICKHLDDAKDEIEKVRKIADENLNINGDDVIEITKLLKLMNEKIDLKIVRQKHLKLRCFYNSRGGRTLTLMDINVEGTGALEPKRIPETINDPMTYEIPVIHLINKDAIHITANDQIGLIKEIALQFYKDENKVEMCFTTGHVNPLPNNKTIYMGFGGVINAQ